MASREFSFLDEVKKRNRKSASVYLGIGDDCAGISLNCPQKKDQILLISTDSLTEGVDFLSRWKAWEAMGQKAVRASLSDLAAMGGQPLGALASLFVPQNRFSQLKQIQIGIEKALRYFKVPLIGGDLSSAKSDLSISITVLGEVTKKNLVTRSGARPGDLIFCSGRVGASGLGLQFQKTKKRSLQRHRKTFFYPLPRLELGRKLAERHLATAMIDVSDGLLQDLCHLLRASGVRAFLDPDRIPLAEGFTRKRGEILQATTSGEDFELLFTGARKFEKKILALGTKACPVTRIGEIKKGKGGAALIDGIRGFSWPTKGLGFQHF